MPTARVESATNGAKRLIHREGPSGRHLSARQGRIGALVSSDSFISGTLENGDVFADVRRDEAAQWIPEDIGIELVSSTRAGLARHPIMTEGGVAIIRVWREELGIVASV